MPADVGRGVLISVCPPAIGRRVSAGRFAKRIFDVLAALCLLIVFMPIMLGCWLILGRAGPAIFRHQRVGADGCAFDVYKFRTMVPDAAKVLEALLASDAALRQEFAQDHKLRDDPRVTPVGKFLRRTSLDEIPQLWNVLKGDMSIVGPRPIVTEEIPKYGTRIRYYYAQKPGITGIWQVSGRNDVSYRRRVAMDCYYSRNRTLWMDLGILLGTIRVVLLGRGAY